MVGPSLSRYSEILIKNNLKEDELVNLDFSLRQSIYQLAKWLVHCQEGLLGLAAGNDIIIIPDL